MKEGSYKRMPRGIILEKLLITYVKSKKAVSCRDVAKKFNMDPYQAGKFLNHLMKMGVLKIVSCQNHEQRNFYSYNDDVNVNLPVRNIRKISSERFQKEILPSSSSSSSSESDSESDNNNTISKSAIRNVSERIIQEA